MSTGWKIYVRDQNYRRVGEVDDYREARFTPVYNDAGTWQLTIDRRSDQAAALTTPGYGITVMRRGASAPVFSGPIAERHHTVNANERTIQISGFTDDIWLKRRLVSPSPTESQPPYTVQATDDLTGQASAVLRHYVDVNLGPNAIAPRRLNGLVVAPDALVGSTVKGSGRWDNLLTFLQTLATSGGVGFRIVQSGFALLFQVYDGVDRSGTVKFSMPLGTLAGFEYQTTAPTGNYAYIGGTGDGTARVMKEMSDSASIATWGRIEGDMVNASDTTDVTKMTQDGTDALTQGAEQTSLSITPLERDGLEYGIDYSLGDVVSVQVEDSPDGIITDILRSVVIHLVKDGPQTVTPSIGTARAADVFRMSRTFRVVTNALQRIRNLETH